jgi:hypothetical protein
MAVWRIKFEKGPSMSIRLIAPAAMILALGACTEREDDVVDATGAPTTEAVAETAQTEAAVAFGMTRRQLEDADIVAADGTDLGDVETLILDAAGVPTQVVIDLEGLDRDVALALTDLRPAPAGANGQVEDLTVDMTAAQLAALPAWVPPAR